MTLNTFLLTTSPDVQPRNISATPIFSDVHTHVYEVVTSATPTSGVEWELLCPQSRVLDNFPEWMDKEYRHAYLEASIEQGLAWQIRCNRKARGMTQEDLAQRLGTQQSAVSRMEDPEYGSHSLDTLISVAHIFDCALSVRLVPYSILAEESQDLSPEALFAASFTNEVHSEKP